AASKATATAARAEMVEIEARRTAAGDAPPRKPRLMTVKSIQKHAREHAEWVARGEVEDRQSGGTAEKQPVSAPAATPEPLDVPDQLRKLGELRDAGVLTEDEFSAKKADLLARM